MKIKNLCIALLVTLMGAGSIYAAPAPEGWLVKDGESYGHLFLPPKMGRPLLLAVEELREYIQKMTGVELPIAYRSPTNDRNKDFGICLLVRNQEDWAGKESSQAFTIEQTLRPTEAVPIRGVTIIGNTETAVLFGVYQYLGDLGVRWFSPGELGENVPKLAGIAIEKGSQSYTPAFLERGLSFSGVHRAQFDLSDPTRYRDVIHREYDLWTLRNRTGFQRNIHTGHWFDFNDVHKPGGHKLKRAALVDVDFNVEPERYALVTRDGVTERQEENAQICFTNEKNVQQAIASAVAFFDDHEKLAHERNTDLDDMVDAFSMGLADCSGICECENCARVAGAPPFKDDRLVWYFMNRVAKGLNEQKPGAKIALYAPYYELKRPPADVSIEPNIVAIACRGATWSKEAEDEAFYPLTKNHSENIDATRAAGAEIRVYDYVLWLGTPQPLNILDAAVAYSERGIQHYHVEVMTRNEQTWPVLWAMSQYLWDSDQDPRALVEEYCSAYYGKGGAVVLDLMNKIDANGKTLPRIGYGGIADTHTMLPDTLIAYGRPLLEAAIDASEGKEQVRLERFRDTFEMFARTAETYRAYCLALNTRTPETIAASEKAFSDYKEFWKTRGLSETCSPNILGAVNRLGAQTIAVNVEPVGRRELDDDKLWIADLYALDTVPETVPDNLFPLPELWKFRVDYMDVGLSEGWQAADWDDSQGWQTISTWNVFERQSYQSIDGRFWYRLKIEIPAFPAGKRVFMRIGSLDDDGDIYMNGQLAYSRKLTFPSDWKTSFEFDVTPFVKPGERNVIAIRGYDAFGAGGLWRPSALYTK